MAQSEAVLRLVVDDRAAKASIARLEKGIEGLGKASIAVNQAMELVSKGARAASAAFEAASDAALTMDAQRVLESTGVSVTQLEQATDGLISKAQLVRQAGLAQQMGIGADAFAELARIAIAASKKTGQSVDFMLDSIITGTARGSKMILDNLGIMIKGAFSMEKVIESGRKMVDEVAKAGANSSDEFARAKKSIDDFAQEIKEVMVPAFNTTLLPVLRDVFELWSEIFGLETGRTRAERTAEANAAAIAKLSARMTKLKETLELVERGYFGIAEVSKMGFAQIAADAQSVDGLIGGLQMAIADLNEEMDKLAGKTPGVSRGGTSSGGAPPAEDDEPPPAPAPGPSEEEIWQAKLYEMEVAMREKLREFGREKDEEERARREKADAERRKAWAESMAMEFEELDEHNNRVVRAEESRAARVKQVRDRELIETQRHYQTMSTIISSGFNLVARESLKAIEDMAAGQKVQVEAIAASTLKTTGTTIIGHGLGTMAGAAGQLALSRGSIGWEALGTGAAIVGAGAAMGGIGAYWAGSIRSRASSAASEGDGLGLYGEDPAAAARGDGGAVTPPRRGATVIEAGAFVFGDLAGGALGMLNISQRGGRFLLGV